MERRFQGVAVSEGIAIGTPFFLHALQEEKVPIFPIALGEVDIEISRYRGALFSSRQDLKKLQSDLSEEGSEEAVTIIDTHIQMLEDPWITTHMEDKIRQMRQNTESVFRSVITEYESRFSKTRDSFFQERLIDVLDLSRRILGHLSHKKDLSQIPEDSIVFAHVLVPSHIAAVQGIQVGAFVTQTGGGHSHAALIARARGIPYVAGIDLSFLKEKEPECIIVDGITGSIIINPTRETLEEYVELKTRLKTSHQLLQKDAHLKTETIDGYSVSLLTNIGSLADLDILHKQEMAGVGLFRSEYLFLQNHAFLTSEELQYKAYIEILEKAQGLPVVFRVFDIGGDKNFFSEKEDPVFGERGLRFLLKHPEIFTLQLKAIFLAAQKGDVRILLPLVTDVEELLCAKTIIEKVRKDLNLPPLPLGCMIEVPSAVLTCDSLLKECDFLSIGTNDLMQYTLGIDRSATRSGDLLAHPSLIRMIKMVMVEAARHNKPVSICGEIASHPRFIPLLLGLGVQEFSCAPRFVPLIKQVIRRITLVQACKIASKALQAVTTTEVSEILKKWHEDL